MARQKVQTNRIGTVGVKLLRWLTPVAGILVFLAIWQIGVMFSGVPAYLLPAPTEIAQTFIDELPKLLRHGWVTTYEMLLGYLLAVAIAIPLAIAITSSQRFDEFVMPTMLFFQVVPKVAVAPLFLVWFGVGVLPKVLVAFLISFFPIVIDTAVGLRSMSVEMTDLARSMGASRMQVFARFRLPTSLPYLFSGLKVAATLAVAGTVVGEFVGADKGLGYLLLVTNSNMETALMFSTLVALTRSEEHTSELQSQFHLVCRLLLEKKKTLNRCGWSFPDNKK